MSHRVSLLVLAQLGLAACNTSIPPSGNNEVTPPLNIPPMPSTSAIGPPRPPAPSVAPIATAAPEPEDYPEPQDLSGRVCSSGADCAKQHMRCQIEPGQKTGRCRPFIQRGRPLVVEGQAQLADYTEPLAPVTNEEIASLREAARDEHASIAAFARTIAELMALGAPLSLLERTQAALSDEIRHTERSLDLIASLTGVRPELGPLTAAVAPLARPIEDFFRDVLHGGAIGETRAAMDAEERRLRASGDELRDFYEMIVVDESRHAALAFETLRWLMTQEPGLRRVLDADTEATALVRPMLPFLTAA